MITNIIIVILLIFLIFTFVVHVDPESTSRNGRKQKKHHEINWENVWEWLHTEPEMIQEYIPRDQSKIATCCSFVQLAIHDGSGLLTQVCFDLSDTNTMQFVQ